MNKLLSVLVVFTGLAAFADQIVIKVPNEDFGPMKSSQWKVMVGNASTVIEENDSRSDASGLSVSLERRIWENIDLGVQFGVLKAKTTIFNTDQQYNNQTKNYDYVNTYEHGTSFLASTYGKFSFVNYSINKWNLLQLNLIGGLAYTTEQIQNTDLVYGASIGYNYDNIIGVELSTKINSHATSLVTTNLIGYF